MSVVVRVTPGLYANVHTVYVNVWFQLLPKTSSCDSGSATVVAGGAFGSGDEALK